MKISEQCCILEQAKKLKELGVCQRPALFYYYEFIENGKTTYPVLPFLNYEFARLTPNTSLLRALEGESNNDIYPAFAVAELGVMLPVKIRLNRADYTLRINLEKSGIWHLKYRTLARGGQMVPLREYHSDNEASVRATMLIWLLENGHVTAEDCNTRLTNS